MIVCESFRASTGTAGTAAPLRVPAATVQTQKYSGLIVTPAMAIRASAHRATGSDRNPAGSRSLGQSQQNDAVVILVCNHGGAEPIVHADGKLRLAADPQGLARFKVLHIDDRTRIGR